MSTTSANHTGTAGARRKPSGNGRAKPELYTDAEAAAVIARVELVRFGLGDDEAERLGAEWGEAAVAAEESGAEGVDDWLRGVHDRDRPRAEAIREALEAARAEASVLPLPEATPEKALFLPLTPSQLYDAHPTMREVIVDGLLRRGEIMNLVAPPKVGKSWLSLSLLFSIAVERAWLGRFAVRKGRVLLIDNELHPETIASRMRWVAESMGLTVEDYEGSVEILPLRGRLRGLASMGEYFESIAGRFDLVILDSGYRFTTPGDDENSNAATTARYNLLDQYADACGAGIAYIHHASKGSQEGKATTDVGAGAGAQSRAVDTHLVLKTDPTLGPGRLLVDAAIRSFAPIESFVIRRDGPLWIADEAAPQPKERQQAARAAKEEEKLREVEASREQTLLAHVGKVIEAIRWLVGEGNPPTKSAIVDHSGLNNTQVGHALARAERDGRITQQTEGVPSGHPGPRTVKTFRMVARKGGGS